MIIPITHSSWWRCLEDVFCLRLQEVLIKTNIFALVIRLQKKSSSRPIQSSCHTSSRRLQDVLKTPSRFIYLFNNLFKVDKFTKIQYTYIHKHSHTNWLIKVNYPILQKKSSNFFNKSKRKRKNQPENIRPA